MQTNFNYFFLFIIILLTSCKNNSPQSICIPQSELGKSVNIIGGEFRFGETRFYQNEGPASKQFVTSFSIDNTEVTNYQFNKFVEETGYITAAELGYNEKDFLVYRLSTESLAQWFLFHLNQMSQLLQWYGGNLLLVQIGATP